MGALQLITNVVYLPTPLTAKENDMVANVKLSFEELSSVLSYNPLTGLISWKFAITSRAKVGEQAGTWQRMKNGKDYLGVTYRGVKMSGAQLAWMLTHREWPDRSVFYVDEDSTNLKLNNLKLADHKSERHVGDDGKTRYMMTSVQARHYGLQSKYGLTYTQYAEMFAAQNGVCAICHQAETAAHPGRKVSEERSVTRDLSVDHDHDTGAIRGLLCNACNHILGEAKDSVATLRSAADYLDKHAASANVVPLTNSAGG